MQISFGLSPSLTDVNQIYLKKKKRSSDIQLAGSGHMTKYTPASQAYLCRCQDLSSCISSRVYANPDQSFLAATGNSIRKKPVCKDMSVEKNTIYNVICNCNNNTNMFEYTVGPCTVYYGSTSFPQKHLFWAIKLNGDQSGFIIWLWMNLALIHLFFSLVCNSLELCGICPCIFKS